MTSTCKLGNRQKLLYHQLNKKKAGHKTLVELLHKLV